MASCEITSLLKFQYGDKKMNDDQKTFIQKCADELKMVLPDDIEFRTHDGLITDDAMEYIFDFLDEVSEQHGITHSNWAINFPDKTIDLNVVPYPNLRSLHYDGHWGKNNQVDFEKAPNFLEIWKACDKMIFDSGDHHHIYIESIDSNDSKDPLESSSFTFYCGS